MKTLKSLSTFIVLLCTITLFSQNYEIYVSTGSGGGSSVKKFAQDGTYIEDFVEPMAGGLNWPQDIIFLEDMGKAIVSGLNNASVGSYDKTSGDYIEEFAPVALGPTRMKIGPDGLIYVLQWNGTGKVLRFQTDGTFVDEFTSTGIVGAIGLVWDASGNLYVSSYSTSTIKKYDSSGVEQADFITSDISGPTNIWFDSNGSGDMIVLNWNGNSASRFDSTGAYLGQFIDSIIRPEGFVYLPSGNLLIGSGGGANSVFEYQSDGTLVGTFASGNGLSNPNAVILRDAHLSVAENIISEVFVTPTVGSQFVFNSSVIEKYNALNVYDTTGRLVETIVPQELGQVWNASNFADGLYFIIAQENGLRATQRIIVKQ